MEWKNQTVAHKVFGTGTVVSLENGMLTVAFEKGEKKFTYPAVFERFLTAENAEAQQTVQHDLAEQQAAQDALRAERERQQAEELERRRTENAEQRRATKRTATRRVIKKV